MDLLFDYVVDWAQAHHIRFRVERVWLKSYTISIEHVLDGDTVRWTYANIKGKKLKPSTPWFDDVTDKFMCLFELCVLDGHEDEWIHVPECWLGYAD